MPRIQTWSIDGMRCASCERLIAQKLRDLPGVEEADVSLRQRRAGIRLAEDAPVPSVDALNGLFESHGYRFREDGAATTRAPRTSCDIATASPRSTLRHRLFRAAIFVAIAGAGVSIFWGPLQRIMPNASSAASVTAMLGLGMIASVSSCLASTGGFLLAYASKQQRTNLIAIHGGRIAAFAIGGAALGGIGGTLPRITPNAAGIASLVLGGILLWAGLHMLDLVPSLAAIGIRPPKSLTAAADRLSTKDGRALTDVIAGAATFVLPCGFTQTAQMLAIASGSATAGSLLLTAFAVGTLPALASLTAVGRSASGSTARHLRLTAGAMLVIFAVIHIDGGLTLVGSRVTPLGTLQTIAQTRASVRSEMIAKNATEQVVRMTVTGSGYSPNSLTVNVGVPVKWIIDGTRASGCTGDIVVPALKIQRTLARGENIITFTPTAPGTIPFSCGMGMVRGAFTVI